MRGRSGDSTVPAASRAGADSRDSSGDRRRTSPQTATRRAKNPNRAAWRFLLLEESSPSEWCQTVGRWISPVRVSSTRGRARPLTQPGPRTGPRAWTGSFQPSGRNCVQHVPDIRFGRGPAPESEPPETPEKALKCCVVTCSGQFGWSSVRSRPVATHLASTAARPAGERAAAAAGSATSSH